MISISISFGSHVAYKVPSLSLSGACHQLQIDFEEGEHVFTSPNFELGTIRAMKDAPLIGRLIFRYTYEIEEGVASITVCDADYESADGMTLMTFPKDREEWACFERASSAGFAADEIHGNGRWNTRSPLLPGASRIFKDIARNAAQAVITALETKEILVNVRTNFPDLPLEVHKQLSAVYRGDEYLCSYDELETGDYGGDLVVWDVFSAYDGTTTFPSKYDFANVLGSTDDKLPKGSKSWIELWRSKIGRKPTVCSSLNDPSTIKCDTSLVGGHVIGGKTAKAVKKGSNIVRIIPICSKHNNVYFTGTMHPIKERKAVKLKKYMEKDV